MTPENTKTKDQKPKTKNQIIWLLFAAVIIAVYFFGLSMPLVGPDEPRYSQVAREMFERGDWVTPTLGGFDWFEKPALLYWLQIAAYNVFGVTEFAARFGSALFGLATVFSLWILGRFSDRWSVAGDQWSVGGGRWSDKEVNAKDQRPKTKDQRPKTTFPNWLALIAASSIGLIVFSRGASFDIILTFPVTASLVGFFIWEICRRKHGEKEDKNLFSTAFVASAALICFYFFIGVALIAKGLVGAVFPPAIAAFYYLLQKKLPPKNFFISLLWGGLLSLLVASSWYLPMYLRNGWKFIDEFIIQHHFQRYTSNKYQHPQPFYFFLWVLPLMTIPWLPFFFAAVFKQFKNLWSAAKGNQKNENENPSARHSASSTQHSQLASFAWAWLLVPLVFFSFSGSKLPGYILPALPAALILTALYVYRLVEKSPKWEKALQALAFATFLTIALLAQFVAPDFVRTETVKHLIETADANGYKTEKILNMHTISHSAEFYGAGRLVREADGKQRRFYGASEIVELMKEENASQVLVLIPLDFLDSLKKNSLLEAQVLDDNGELAIVLVKERTLLLSRPPEPIHQS
jgi:4-amino-4-deoxy-L-arabinose transferase-like glycosyltransferase